MNIGKTKRTIRVEPATTPVPQRETIPRRQPIPRKEPATPTRTPEKAPEKV